MRFAVHGLQFSVLCLPSVPSVQLPSPEAPIRPTANVKRQTTGCISGQLQVYTCIVNSNPNPTPRTRSYGDLPRQRILDAPERVFSRDGFQGATTREIAREAGVNEVTLFRHFRTRDDLLRDTILCRSMAPDALLGPPP